MVACGRWPAKAVQGETVSVFATVFREGHDAVGANVIARAPAGNVAASVPMRLIAPGTDRYQADFAVDRRGRWSFSVESWGDPVRSWRHAARAKAEAGQGVDEMAVDIEDGARLLERAAAGVPARHRRALGHAVDTLRDETLTQVSDRLAPALSPNVVDILTAHPLREHVTVEGPYDLWVDRQRALFGSWYELFPRSEGAHPDPRTGALVSGTFRTAAERLPAVAGMGFDVVYLPPIHPIGEINRKGPNNTLAPGPDDPGSPWAIGSRHGGHDAIHPDLGSLEDFDAFVARARDLGMEVAIDLALQCAPDHPWAAAHPEWFTLKSDGSIAYAENPPKKYQDIYPVNFDKDPEGIYTEVLRVIRHWMDHGVRIFRVDNPHTKPLPFWERLIDKVRKTDPDVLWLAEAFTRPPMMHTLAQIGFTQSYTYFTWRNEKWELEEYLRELSTSPTADYMRPNFFVNTPDILHAYLQHGGPPAFKVRAVLASMLSPAWGVYAGYELYENQPVRQGSEEYLDSEKYQLRPREWNRPDSLAPYLTILNRVRREHPALQRLRNLHLHHADNPNVMAFSKTTGSDIVVVVVNLDPHATQQASLQLDMPTLGFGWRDVMEAHDEVTGQTFWWGERPYVRLDPDFEPAHILTIRRG